MTTLHRSMARLALTAAAAVFPACALAQDPARPGIYSCDINGKRLVSERPIAECASRDQRVLNNDGSVRKIMPPTLTVEERSELEVREREAMQERMCKQDAMRRDRNLTARYPNEAAHRKARESSLNDINKAVSASDARIAALTKERKPMNDEAEFYVGKTMPTKLKTQLETNDALVEAQRSLIANQGNEIGRINRLYDAELVHLKRLWAGVQPGAESNCSAAGAPVPKS